MIQLTLTLEEEQVLKEELKARLSELDLEILHTDRAEFKQMLKHRRAVLAKAADQLPEAAVVTV